MSEVPDMAAMRVFDERDQWKARALKAEAECERLESTALYKLMERQTTARLKAEEALREIDTWISDNSMDAETVTHIHAIVRTALNNPPPEPTP